MAVDKKIRRRLRIKHNIRKKISGTAELPRLSVYKSNKGIYAQLIDDINGHTLAHATSLEAGEKNYADVSASKEVGKSLAERAVAKGISSVVFDRNGYLFHGKVKALADGARDGGLKF